MKYYQNRWLCKSRKDARTLPCLVSLDTRLHHLWVLVTCGPHHPWAPTTCGLHGPVRFIVSVLDGWNQILITLPSCRLPSVSIASFPPGGLSFKLKQRFVHFLLKLIFFLKLNFWLLYKGFLCDISCIYHYTLFLPPHCLAPFLFSLSCWSHK